LCDVVESLGLGATIRELAAQGERLGIRIQRGLGLSQAVVDAADIVEGRRLVGLIPQLPVQQESFLEAAERRRQVAAEVLEEAEVAAGLHLVEALLEALPQGERAAQGFAGRILLLLVQ